MRLFRRQPRPMDCIELVEVVTDYLEGALAEPDRRALEHHLSLCSGCRSYVEQMRATLRLTGRLVVEDIPPEGTEALLDAFRAYQAERSDG
jgi:predicted anti-sigma-YlaC factor YlaD